MKLPGLLQQTDYILYALDFPTTSLLAPSNPLSPILLLPTLSPNSRKPLLWAKEIDGSAAAQVGSKSHSSRGVCIFNCKTFKGTLFLWSGLMHTRIE